MAQSQTELGQESLETALRHLRRHAQALTGNREIADDLVDQTSHDLYALPNAVLPQTKLPRLLFKAFHKKFSANGFADVARAAFLLHGVEGFTATDIGKILGISTQEAQAAVTAGTLLKGHDAPLKVLLVEDEAIIAMDLTMMVVELGHIVTGVGMTHAEALEIALQNPPDLIILDIELADGSSGLDAIHELIAISDEVPVIFSTGHPDRLLTAQADTPVYLLRKPSSDREIESAIRTAAEVLQRFPDRWHQSLFGLSRFWPPRDC